MVPKFYGEGEDAWGWLIAVEQHFQAKKINEDEQLAEAVSGLRGCALWWYRRWNRLNPNANWWSFNKAFVSKYLPEICLVDDAESEPQEQQQKFVWEEGKIMEEVEEKKRVGLVTEVIENLKVDAIKKKEKQDEEDDKGSVKDKRDEDVEHEEIMASEEENGEEVERQPATMVVNPPDLFSLERAMVLRGKGMKEEDGYEQVKKERRWNNHHHRKPPYVSIHEKEESLCGSNEGQRLQIALREEKKIRVEWGRKKMGQFVAQAQMSIQSAQTQALSIFMLTFKGNWITVLVFQIRIIRN